MFRVTRRYEFAASHRLHAAALGEEENRRLYGKCNNPYGHGHNYVVEVSAHGPLDQATGSAVDAGRLDGLVAREVLEPFHQRNLNLDIAAFAAHGADFGEPGCRDLPPSEGRLERRVSRPVAQTGANPRRRDGEKHL